MGYIGADPALNESVTSAQIADDAITLAKMASGTDGAMLTYDADGNPVAITGTDGQVATSAGANAVSAFEAAGGITHATGYRVSTNLNGDYDPITAWELIDTADYASLGSIVTVDTGVFTFPSTGIWRVELTAGAYATAASGGAELTTTIEVAGTLASRAHSYLPDNTYGWCTCFHQVDVTDLGTQTINVTCGGGVNVNVLGSSTYSRTQLWFTRLGDT